MDVSFVRVFIADPAFIVKEYISWSKKGVRDLYKQEGIKTELCSFIQNTGKNKGLNNEDFYVIQNVSIDS